MILTEGTYDSEPFAYSQAERKEQQQNYALTARMIPKLVTMQPSELETMVKKSQVDPATGEKLHQYL